MTAAKTVISSHQSSRGISVALGGSCKQAMAQTCIANRQREKNDDKQQHGNINHAQTTLRNWNTVAFVVAQEANPACRKTNF
jgi:hypothetical protein